MHLILIKTRNALVSFSILVEMFIYFYFNTIICVREYVGV